MAAVVRLPAPAAEGAGAVKINSIWLRRIHKWIGLIIGIQFLLWTISGATMAILGMEQVAGGARAPAPEVPMTTVDRWPSIRTQLGGEAVLGLQLRPLLAGQVYEVETRSGVRLFDAATARPVLVDDALATRVAASAYAGSGQVERVSRLDELTLAVREHELPIWRVNFAGEQNSSFYVSGSTGTLLERRNDTWRLWDFVWMLHNMDYVNRTSFNHPLIITVGFAAVWLAITGFWLFFRTGWRSDFRSAGPRQAIIRRGRLRMNLRFCVFLLIRSRRYQRVCCKAPKKPRRASPPGPPDLPADVFESSYLEARLLRHPFIVSTIAHAW